MQTDLYSSATLMPGKQNNARNGMKFCVNSSSSASFANIILAKVKPDLQASDGWILYLLVRMKLCLHTV